MQHVLIHQIVFDQGVNKNTTPIQKDVFSGLALQLANFINHIAADEDGVPPSFDRLQGGGSLIGAPLLSPSDDFSNPC